MSCVGNMCGTGGAGLPLPDDPSNDGNLAATAIAAGIELSWTLPLTNPHAVAHTLVYRSIDNVFNNALQIAIHKGDRFTNRVAAGRPYWYWVRHVSVRGTMLNPIGPAASEALDSKRILLEELTGLIDAGVLAQSLRERIESISLLEGDLLEEVQNRFGANSALAQAIAELQSNVDGAVSVIAEEIVERQEADSVLIDSMSLIGVKINDNTAAIVEEATVRANNDSAMASRIITLESSSGVDHVARATIQDEATTRANADTALANRLTTVESADSSGQIAQVEQRLQTNINSVESKAESLYTMKLSANGLIGGFGVYNNSQYVEAGFDVDTFWVGRTNGDKIKPFIIQNGVVYIHEARIKNAYIETAMIGVNQVVVPIGAYTAGGIMISYSNQPQEIQSVTINATGAPIFVIATAATSESSLGPVVFYLQRNGETIYTSSFSTGTTGCAAAIIDTPGSGQITYRLYVQGGNYVPDESDTSTGTYVNARTIQLLEIKR